MGKSKRNSKLTTPTKDRRQQQQGSSYANAVNNSAVSPPNNSKHPPPRSPVRPNSNLQVLTNTLREADDVVDELGRRLGEENIAKLQCVIDRLNSAASAVGSDELDTSTEHAKKDYVRALQQTMFLTATINGLRRGVQPYNVVREVSPLAAAFSIDASSSPSKSASCNHEQIPRSTPSRSTPPTKLSRKQKMRGAPKNEGGFVIVETRQNVGVDGSRTTHKYCRGGLLGKVSKYFCTAVLIYIYNTRRYLITYMICRVILQSSPPHPALC